MFFSKKKLQGNEKIMICIIECFKMGGVNHNNGRKPMWVCKYLDKQIQNNTTHSELAYTEI